MQSGESEDNYKLNLDNLVSQSHSLFISGSYQESCKVYEQISIKLNYLLRIIKWGLLNCAKLKNSLRICMNTLATFVQSTQYLKYSHRFPLLQKVLQNYQKLIGQKVQLPEKEKIIQLVHKNQQSASSRIFGFDRISEDEINFLKSQKVDSFYGDLMNEQIIMQNPQCICCSPVFIKDLQIFNNNPLISVVAELSQKKGFDQVILESYVNAVCNKRGGVIIIGAEKNNDREIAVGIRFKNMQEVFQRQTEINMAIMRIKPICHYVVQRVLVHTNYINHKKINQQFMRICFRIVIFPYQPERINYNEILNKGYHKIYEVFKLDYLKKPYKITSAYNSDLSKYEGLYTMIHEKYRQSKQIISSHQNILCFNPYSDYSKIFNQYVKQGSLIQVEEQIEVKEKQEIVYEDQPKFKYKYTSLLVGNTQKSKRYIDDFGKMLKAKKQLFQLSKPFQKSFQDVGRIIWMISHEIELAQLLINRKELQLTVGLKQSPFVILPLLNTFRIQKSKYDEKREQIEKRFQARYSQLYETQVFQIIDEHKKLKTVTLFHFSGYNQALFAYMICESFLLKPFFCKNISKPKTKIFC